MSSLFVNKTYYISVVVRFVVLSFFDQPLKMGTVYLPISYGVSLLVVEQSYDYHRANETKYGQTWALCFLYFPASESHP